MTTSYSCVSFPSFLSCFPFSFLVPFHSYSFFLVYPTYFLPSICRVSYLRFFLSFLLPSITLSFPSNPLSFPFFCSPIFFSSSSLPPIVPSYNRLSSLLVFSPSFFPPFVHFISFLLLTSFQSPHCHFLTYHFFNSSFPSYVATFLFATVSHIITHSHFSFQFSIPLSRYYLQSGLFCSDA